MKELHYTPSQIQVDNALAGLTFPKSKKHHKDILDIAYYRGFAHALNYANMQIQKDHEITRQQAITDLLKAAGQGYDAISHAICEVANRNRPL